ncbi:ATP-dependent acyl-CoA ligase [Nocardioides endophyticus]|uniref:ATP-dependent acyl-CoA ligase n=1 Tax=Nocardioides endophyticus TaxID=1353775 RepID=A0ABP8YFN5_9ACTN
MTKTSELFLDRTLTGMLVHQAERSADKVALTIVGQDLTYADVIARSNSVARGLLELGVGHGDVVAVLAENCADQVLIQFATARLRAIEVMLNTAYKGDFLSHQLKVSGAKVIVVDEALVANLLEVVDLLPELEHIIVRGGSASLDAPSRLTVSEVALLHGHDQAPLDREDPLWSDPSTITFTSGTTGPSKGATMTQNYMCNFAEIEASIWYRTPEDTFYSCGPLFHLAAKGIGVLGAMRRGVRCVQDERLSVSTFWKRIREENCNATLMLGSVAMLLWTLDPSEDEGVDTIVGVPAPPVSLQPAMEERWGCKFESVYGMTEAAPLSVTGPTIPLRPGSSGAIVREYFDVRIFDDNDFELPRGEIGEVVVRPMQPHSIFEGYYREPEATAIKFRNLWFHTGDLGRIDDDDYFYFEDRKDDYLRRRGENISSYEVETAIVKHPAVLQVGVVGVESEMAEQEVKASIVLRPGVALDQVDLIDHCIKSMPYFAVPRYVEYLSELPFTPSGKMRKEKLRATGTSGCWDREAAGIQLSGKNRSGVPAPEVLA